MARQPTVTGQGAKWAAQGLAAQRKRQVTARGSGMNAGMSNMWGNAQNTAPPLHNETAPPMSSAPTGTEHLSAPLFKGTANPRQYEISRTATSSMHPGGFGQTKSLPPTPMHPGGFSQMNMSTQRPNASVPLGNFRPGAPQTMRSLPKPTATKTTAGTKTVSKAPANPSGRAGTRKPRRATRVPFKVHASRFAGRLASHLKAATGDKS